LLSVSSNPSPRRNTPLAKVPRRSKLPLIN
jgi:hypothetical protein